VPPGGDFNDPMWDEYEARHLPTLTDDERKAFLAFQKWFDIEREKAHNVGAGENDTYWLVLLATEERARNNGQASALIEYGLKYADENGLACSLETGSEKSARFYEKFGFVIHHSAELPFSTPPKQMYFMRREKRIKT